MIALTPTNLNYRQQVEVDYLNHKKHLKMSYESVNVLCVM